MCIIIPSLHYVLFLFLCFFFLTCINLNCFFFEQLFWLINEYQKIPPIIAILFSCTLDNRNDDETLIDECDSAVFFCVVNFENIKKKFKLSECSIYFLTQNKTKNEIISMERVWSWSVDKRMQPSVAKRYQFCSCNFINRKRISYTKNSKENSKRYLLSLDKKKSQDWTIKTLMCVLDIQVNFNWNCLFIKTE